MSKSILLNIPEAEKLLDMETDELAGYVLEHLHAAGGNRLSQGDSLPHNLANGLAPRYPRKRDGIYKAIVSACHWLINNGYLNIINGQGFYEISPKGMKVKTANEFNAQLNRTMESAGPNASAQNVIGTLELFLTELSDIEASLPEEGYSKNGQRFDRWKSRCVRFIAANLSEEEAKNLSRYEMLDTATPQIARQRHDHTVRTLTDCRSFLDVLLDEVRRYGDHFFKEPVQTTVEGINESLSSGGSQAEPSPHGATQDHTQQVEQPLDALATNQGGAINRIKTGGRMTNTSKGAAVAIAVALITTAGVVIASIISNSRTKDIGQPPKDLPVEYSGRVVAPDGSPVRNAEVSLESTGAPVIVRTDSNGVYEISVTTEPPLGSSRRVRVRASGFLEYDRFLPVASTRLFEDIHLSPVPGTVASGTPQASSSQTPDRANLIRGAPPVSRLQNTNRPAATPTQFQPPPSDVRTDRHCDPSTVKVVSANGCATSECFERAGSFVIRAALPGDSYEYSFGGRCLVCSCKAK